MPTSPELPDAGAAPPDAAASQEHRPETRGSSIWDRVVRVLKLDPGVFLEIGSDDRATMQASIVIALASGVGAIWYFFVAPVFVLSTFASIAFTTGVVWVVLLVLAPTRPSYVRLFRAFGYGAAPLALGIVPILGSFIGGIYMIVLNVVAIREVGQVSTGQAVLAYALTLFVVLMLGTVLAVIFGLSLLTLAGVSSLT